MATRTAAEIQATLDDYIAARDVILDALAEGKQFVEIEIRSRRVRVSDPNNFLKTLEDMIDRYEDKLCKSSNGMAVNLAKFKSRRSS